MSQRRFLAPLGLAILSLALVMGCQKQIGYQGAKLGMDLGDFLQAHPDATQLEDPAQQLAEKFSQLSGESLASSHFLPGCADCLYFVEEPDEDVWQSFAFLDKQLHHIFVSYGDSVELSEFKAQLQKKYGKPYHNSGFGKARLFYWETGRGTIFIGDPGDGQVLLSMSPQGKTGFMGWLILAFMIAVCLVAVGLLQSALQEYRLFLDNIPVIETEQHFAAFKQLAKRDMYSALLMFVVIPAPSVAAILGFVTDHSGLGTLVLSVGIGVVIFLRAQTLQVSTKQLQNLQSSDPHLQQQIVKIVECWNRKALPNW